MCELIKDDGELLEEILLILDDEECLLKIMVSNIENECPENGALRVLRRDVENLKQIILKHIYNKDN